MVVKYTDFWEILGATQHREFENKIESIILDKGAREEFYRNILEKQPSLDTDTFKGYFELYNAERKSNQQDYTPDSVANLLARFTSGSKTFGYNAYDATAGTGTLLITKWNHQRRQVSPFNYRPRDYFYRADELADNAIPYLIHNLVMRGMNAIVCHGDSIERKYKNIYFIFNSEDDHSKFSDVNIMPRSKDIEQEFNVTEWIGEEVKHIESPLIDWNTVFGGSENGGENGK